MHFATHGHTVAEAIAERVDADKPFLELRSTRPGGGVRKDEVGVAKYYLTEDELQVLNRIVNVYLELAELQALDRRPMSMQNWISKFDEFLRISGRDLLDHAGQISAEAASTTAELEYVRYQSSDPQQLHRRQSCGHCATGHLYPAREPWASSRESMAHAR